MASTDSSHTCRQASPGMQARIEIGRCFFGDIFQAKDLRAFEAYFRYYESEIAMLQFGSSPLSRQSANLAAKTHEDILYIARILQQCGSETRSAVRRSLQTRFPDDVENLHMGYHADSRIDGTRSIMFLYRLTAGMATGL